MRVLGIDFGTSNTVAMVRYPDGRIRQLLFDGTPLLPSAVYYNPDGRMLIGRDAERNARLDPSRFEPNPKRRIDDGQVFLGDVEMPVPRVFSFVLAQVAAEARRQLGAAPDEVRLTHPARWGERRRSLLVEASRLAGLGAPRLIAEPVGAASYFTAVLGSAVPVGRSLAIYDLGGGTFDATVVRRTQTGFEVLAEEGLPDVGGLDLDHAIVEHIGEMYKDDYPEQWATLVNPADANDRRQRRMLFEDVRGAKESLSRTASADLHLPALDVDAHLTREELESLVRPYLDRTVVCLKRTIDNARLSPQQLVGIFLVGGSSRIPLAAHLIHSELGVAPTTLEQPETVVVEGALCIGGGAPPRANSGTPRPAPPLRRPPGPGQMPGRPNPPPPMPPRPPVNRPPAGPGVAQRPVGQPQTGPGRPVGAPQAGPARPPLAPQPGGMPRPPMGGPGQPVPPPGQQMPPRPPLGGQNQPPVGGPHQPPVGGAQPQPPAGGAPRTVPMNAPGPAGNPPPAGPGRVPMPAATQPPAAPPQARVVSAPPHQPVSPSPVTGPPQPQRPPTGQRVGPFPPGMAAQATRQVSTPPVNIPPPPAPPRITPGPATPAPRPWYSEPTKVAIVIVLTLVAIGFLVLLSLVSFS